MNGRIPDNGIAGENGIRPYCIVTPGTARHNDKSPHTSHQQPHIASGIIAKPHITHPATPLAPTTENSTPPATPLAPTIDKYHAHATIPYPNDTSTRDKTIKHTILPAYVDHHLPTEYTEKP